MVNRLLKAVENQKRSSFHFSADLYYLIVKILIKLKYYINQQLFFQINDNRNTEAMFENSSKLTTETPELSRNNFVELISQIVLVFLLLILNNTTCV